MANLLATELRDIRAAVAQVRGKPERFAAGPHRARANVENSSRDRRFAGGIPTRQKICQRFQITRRKLADKVLANVGRRLVVDLTDAFHELDSLAEKLLTCASV